MVAENMGEEKLAGLPDIILVYFVNIYNNKPFKNCTTDIDLNVVCFHKNGGHAKSNLKFLEWPVDSGKLSNCVSKVTIFEVSLCIMCRSCTHVLGGMATSVYQCYTSLTGWKDMERSPDPQGREISNEQAHFTTRYGKDSVLAQFDFDFLLFRNELI